MDKDIEMNGLEEAPAHTELSSSGEHGQLIGASRDEQNHVRECWKAIYQVTEIASNSTGDGERGAAEGEFYLGGLLQEGHQLPAS